MIKAAEGQARSTKTPPMIVQKNASIYISRLIKP